MVENTSPVLLTLDAPLEITRWRPLVNWLLAIPQFVVLWALQIVLEVLTFVAFFTILFTKKIPESISAFMVMIYRYNWRVVSYAGFLRESYPPFDFTSATIDPETDPARVTIVPQEEYRRFMPLVKWLLAIPHIIALFFVWIGAIFMGIYAFFAVLFTGRWPEGARRYIVGAARWNLRVQAYAWLLTDVYPPFSLD